jgi:hypothetical protein
MEWTTDKSAQSSSEMLCCSNLRSSNSRGAIFLLSADPGAVSHLNQNLAQIGSLHWSLVVAVARRERALDRRVANRSALDHPQRAHHISAKGSGVDPVLAVQFRPSALVNWTRRSAIS